MSEKVVSFTIRIAMDVSELSSEMVKKLVEELAVISQKPATSI